MESMVDHRKDTIPTTSGKHQLHDTWTLWAHLPHDTDWSVSSYKEILTLNTMEDALMLFENLPEVMIKNCMLFLMREGIQPIWEDEKNKNFAKYMRNFLILFVTGLTFIFIIKIFWLGNLLIFFALLIPLNYFIFIHGPRKTCLDNLNDHLDNLDII